MRTICLYFQIHQPLRHRRYRFFDIGNDHYYYDDYLNESVLQKVAEKCYLPANRLLLELVRKYDGKFKLAFSISGIAIDQFETYAPEVIDSFRQLADTGNVEFLSETYAHSLVSLKDKDEFTRQVDEHKEKMVELFAQEPQVFRNTELIYSDEIGAMVAEMGYRGMITEGAKHVLGWKSPNFVYTNAIKPRLKVLLKNFKLSDDIAFRFSNKEWPEYPLTTGKFVKWLNKIDKKDETINLFMDYETFGEHQWADTGIFEFLRAFPETVLNNSDYTFSTPSEVIRDAQPVGSIHVPNPISWADEERDLTAWLGNPLQEQAFRKLYSLLQRLRSIDHDILKKDFRYLQNSDHFYYMCTKFFSDGEVHSYFNPFDTPYEAFINYMNILSDFEIRLNALVADSTDDEIVRLSKIISEKDLLIQKFEKQILTLKSQKKKPLKRETKLPVQKVSSSKTSSGKNNSESQKLRKGKASPEKTSAEKRSPKTKNKASGKKKT